MVKPPISARNLALLLLASDITGLLLTFKLSFWLRLDLPVDWSATSLYVFMGLTLLGLYLADTYHPQTRLTGLPAWFRVILSNTLTAIVAATLIYLAGVWGKGVLFGRGIQLLGLVLFTLWAIAARVVAAQWARSQGSRSRWLVLGGGETAVRLLQEVRALNSQAEVFFWAETQEDGELLVAENLPRLTGSFEEVAAGGEKSWCGVLVATKPPLSDSFMRKLMHLRLQGVLIYNLPDFYEQFWYKIPPFFLQDDWFAFTAGFGLLHNRISLKMKRLIDMVAAGLLLVAMSPLMLLVAIAIVLDSRGSVFYTQVRTGVNGSPFRVYKFRSMVRDAEKKGVQWASTSDSRITRVGRWLRMLRIDELPQLWNVLKGEMSLIGPRPERPEFDVQLGEAIPYYDVRYLVKPGITGWAQVMYPYGASVEDAYQKLAYDLYYIKNYSLFLDVAIALRTVRVVLFGKGR